jgi:hypothetical protein
MAGTFCMKHATRFLVRESMESSRYQQLLQVSVLSKRCDGFGHLSSNAYQGGLASMVTIGLLPVIHLFFSSFILFK